MSLKVSFSTLACPDWSWADVIAFGPSYGYDGVEIRQLGGELDLLAVPELQEEHWPQRLEELITARFRVCGLASSIKFDGLAEDDLAQQLATGKGYLKMAHALGAQFVRVFGDVLPPPDQPEDRARTLDRVVAGLRELGQVAEEFNVPVLLETHGSFTSSAIAAEVMERVDHPQVGLVWDTHHAWRFDDEPLVETWDRIRPWVRHTHWKDSVTLHSGDAPDRPESVASQAALPMGGHRHADYVLFRGGEFPAIECLQLLQSSGYSFWHSLEWEKLWHPELVGPEVALPLFPVKMRELLQLVNITNPPTQI